MDERILKMVARFGERYWVDGGVRTKNEFQASAAHWRTALEYFLAGYAFERLGGFPSYVKASLKALEHYCVEHRDPGEDFERVMWNSFCQEVDRQKTKLNPRLDLLRPVDGQGKISLTRLLLDIPGNNLVAWTRDRIMNGDAKTAYNRIHSVRGIGDKIAALFMRDVAVGFEIGEEMLSPPKYFQPIDVWTERGAKALAQLMGIKEPTASAEYVNTIIEAGCQVECGGASALIINTGLWYLGTSTQMDEDRFYVCLTNYGELSSWIEWRAIRREKEAAFYREILTL